MRVSHSGLWEADLCPRAARRRHQYRRARRPSGLGRPALPPTEPVVILQTMEHRLLGRSGFKVPVLTLGTGTFGGKGDFFKGWGGTQAAEATRLVDICLEAGLTMFDSADGYSGGLAEEILGAAIRGTRDNGLISTKG